MTIFFKEYFNIYTIGNADFLNSFFSTVYYNLESQKWGSRFPIIMNDLYQGKVQNINVKNCIDEIVLIIEEIKKIDISRLIWDFEDLKKSPPKEYSVLNKSNLFEFFITKNNVNLMELLRDVLYEALKYKTDIEVVARNVFETWLNPENSNNQMPKLLENDFGIKNDALPKNMIIDIIGQQVSRDNLNALFLRIRDEIKIVMNIEFKRN